MGTDFIKVVQFSSRDRLRIAMRIEKDILSKEGTGGRAGDRERERRTKMSSSCGSRNPRAFH